MKYNAVKLAVFMGSSPEEIRRARRAVYFMERAEGSRRESWFNAKKAKHRTTNDKDAQP